MLSAFTALYAIHYTIADPETLTIGERDHALKTFYAELQSYVDGLSEAEIISGGISENLSQKAEDIADSLSTGKINLTCEISNIEIHNDGTEIHE